MIENSADGFLPPGTLAGVLAKAVQGCQGCDLYLNATQAVFGEGSAHARAMLIGEQPGDREDVGGSSLRRAGRRGPRSRVGEAGIDRADVYVTNVVKHFRWKAAPRGKRRIHRKPDLREQLACRPWLDAELHQVRPTVLVCLGATAAQALLGRSFRVTQDRGLFVESPLAPVRHGDRAPVIDPARARRRT